MLDLDKIFCPKPMPWGLRGDPYLWEELEAEARTWEIPAAHFYQQLLELFHQLTQQALEEGETEIYIERYPKGGISGGYVSLSWWQSTGLPLLKKRIEAQL